MAGGRGSDGINTLASAEGPASPILPMSEARRLLGTHFLHVLKKGAGRGAEGKPCFLSYFRHQPSGLQLSPVPRNHKAGGGRHPRRRAVAPTLSESKRGPTRAQTRTRSVTCAKEQPSESSDRPRRTDHPGEAAVTPFLPRAPLCLLAAFLLAGAAGPQERPMAFRYNPIPAPAAASACPLFAWGHWRNDFKTPQPALSSRTLRPLAVVRQPHAPDAPMLTLQSDVYILAVRTVAVLRVCACVDERNSSGPRPPPSGLCSLPAGPFPSLPQKRSAEARWPDS